MLRPFFSIIVPTFNRPRNLTTCLQALSRLAYPADRYEVIVVDDGGDATLADVITPFAGHLNLKLLAQPNAGPAAARNRGAAEANGDYLAFLDDDCSPAESWLSQLAGCLESSPGRLVGGRTSNGLSNNIYANASQRLIDYLYDYYNSDHGNASFFTSNNLAVSARLFRKLAGFDSTMYLAGGEDREFCARWLNDGHKLTFVPEALVYHYHHLNQASFLRQHFSYGRGAWMFHRRRAHQNHQPMRLEPLRFYLDLLRYPLRRARIQRGISTTILFMMSQVANVAGFIWELLAERLSRAPQALSGQVLNRTR